MNEFPVQYLGPLTTQGQAENPKRAIPFRPHPARSGHGSRPHSISPGRLRPRRRAAILSNRGEAADSRWLDQLTKCLNVSADSIAEPPIRRDAGAKRDEHLWLVVTVESRRVCRPVLNAPSAPSI